MVCGIFGKENKADSYLSAQPFTFFPMAGAQWHDSTPMQMSVPLPLRASDGAARLLCRFDTDGPRFRGNLSRAGPDSPRVTGSSFPPFASFYFPPPAARFQSSVRFRFFDCVCYRDVSFNRPVYAKGTCNVRVRVSNLLIV